MLLSLVEKPTESIKRGFFPWLDIDTEDKVGPDTDSDTKEVSSTIRTPAFELTITLSASTTAHHLFEVIFSDNNFHQIIAQTNIHILSQPPLLSYREFQDMSNLTVQMSKDNAIRCIGLCTNKVNNLAEPLKEKGYCLITNFSLVDLLQDLFSDGISCIATTQADRRKWPQELKSLVNQGYHKTVVVNRVQAIV